MNMTVPRAIRLPALLLAIAILSACGRDDAASYLKSAQNYVEKRDYRAAIIEVKNALQKEPDNGEARLLLAKAFLETGDPANAETEHRKAIALKATDDRTYP